jgi:hypothetical protein
VAKSPDLELLVINRELGNMYVHDKTAIRTLEVGVRAPIVTGYRLDLGHDSILLLLVMTTLCLLAGQRVMTIEHMPERAEHTGVGEDEPPGTLSPGDQADPGRVAELALALLDVLATLFVHYHFTPP